MNNLIKCSGAQDETRTHTPLPALPPQSSVYTNFTTCAYNRKCPEQCQGYEIRRFPVKFKKASKLLFNEGFKYVLMSTAFVRILL
jgi:hypothetical protein